MLRLVMVSFSLGPVSGAGVESDAACAVAPSPQSNGTARTPPRSPSTVPAEAEAHASCPTPVTLNRSQALSSVRPVTAKVCRAKIEATLVPDQQGEPRTNAPLAFVTLKTTFVWATTEAADTNSMIATSTTRLRVRKTCFNMHVLLVARQSLLKYNPLPDHGPSARGLPSARGS